MKLKRLSALMLKGVMALSVVACGGNKSTDDTQSASKKDDGGIISYTDLDLDKDCKDLKAEITFSSNRTAVSYTHLDVYKRQAPRCLHTQENKIYG